MRTSGAPFGVFRAGNKDAPDGKCPDSRINTPLPVAFPGRTTQWRLGPGTNNQGPSTKKKRRFPLTVARPCGHFTHFHGRRGQRRIAVLPEGWTARHDRLQPNVAHQRV